MTAKVLKQELPPVGVSGVRSLRVSRRIDSRRATQRVNFKACVICQGNQAARPAVGQRLPSSVFLIRFAIFFNVQIQPKLGWKNQVDVGRESRAGAGWQRCAKNCFDLAQFSRIGSGNQ